MKYKISAWIVGIMACGWLINGFLIINTICEEDLLEIRIFGIGAACLTVYLIYKSKEEEKQQKYIKEEEKPVSVKETNSYIEKKYNYEIIYWYGTKIPYKENYYKDGKLHRIGGPAYKLYYANSKAIGIELYCIEGKKHREDGPAYISYYEDGQISSEQYYKNGKLHREDGPAVIKNNDNGSIKEELYYQNNKLYRSEGPVAVYYDKNGNIEQ